MFKNLQFVVFGVLILAVGVYHKSPFGLVGLVLLLWPAFGWLIGGANSETQSDKWLKSLPETNYKFAKDAHGIALDETARTLHLFVYGVIKTYPFSDIREWKTNISTGGKFITGNIASIDLSHLGRANRRQEKENQEETGLFISVRDINTPQWRIRFSENLKDEQRLQAQWMEIFKQVVKGE